MGHKTYFHIKQTGRNLRQSWPTQLMTVMTISLSVLIFSFFLLIYINLINAGNLLGDELRLIVYLNEEVRPEVRPMYEKKIKDFHCNYFSYNWSINSNSIAKCFNGCQ